MSIKNLRMQIVISTSCYKRLKRWARFHGMSPSTYAGQIVANRIEANLDIIEKLDRHLTEDGILDDETEETTIDDD